MFVSFGDSHDLESPGGLELCIQTLSACLLDCLVSEFSFFVDLRFTGINLTGNANFTHLPSNDFIT